MTRAINPAIFRAYDIRGVAERDLPDEVATAIGRAFAERLLAADARTVAVGRDVRPSSPRITRAVTAALVEAGLEVTLLGAVSTPMLYFAVRHFGFGGGLMVTASHNPTPDNGMKMLVGTKALSGDAIAAIGARAQAGAHPVRPGGTALERDILEDYVGFLAAGARMGSRKLKVALDGGNGMSGPSLLPLLDRLGVEHLDLYCDPDGRFPNHHPDPTQLDTLEDLRALVLREGCDLGLAFDGDGDRIGALDERGRVLHGDRILMIYARALLGEEPGAKIVGEVKCSEVLFDQIRAWGGVPIMSRVGHSFIKETLRTEGALLAGEMSGHMFFQHRYYGYDDAVYAAMRLLEIASNLPADAPFSSLLGDVPEPRSTPELRVECADAVKFRVVEQVAAHFQGRNEVVTIDGARIKFSGGWGLVRASNTQPALVLRFEADTEEHLAAYRDEVMRVLETAIAGARS